MANLTHTNSLPILYSFRRCPYAIRARMAIIYSQLQVNLREVSLQKKPQELELVSVKATVPVLQIDSDTILDESLDIMFWALNKNDTDKLQLSNQNDYRQIPLISENDGNFKKHLDHYKYADRFPQHDPVFYRQQAEFFIIKLDEILRQQDFLMGEKLSIVDYAIFPFVRQFAHVDAAWFEQSRYKHVQKWLNYFLNSSNFCRCMHKYSPWKNGDEDVIFPSSINMDG